MATPLTFCATALAPHAPQDARRISRLAPDDSEAGGFAKLMRGTLADGTPVAVKRFHRTAADCDAYAADGAAARREFDCLCALNGADGHAPRAFALGTCTDKQGLVHHAIVMEYVEGFTVEQALSSGILSGNARLRDKTHTILEAARHIIAAVDACSRVVVHRDISPANIILVMNGAGEVDHAVLIDWGQSISACSPLVTPALGAQRKLATVCFGAPCVFGGDFYHLRNEPSVDVYSFGALLYYMRLRKLPYADVVTSSLMTPQQVERVAAAKMRPLTLREGMPSLRPIEQHLDDLIRACTAYDPSLRPTPREAARLVERALGAEDAEEAEYELVAEWDAEQGAEETAEREGERAARARAVSPMFAEPDEDARETLPATTAEEAETDVFADLLAALSGFNTAVDAANAVVSPRAATVTPAPAAQPAARERAATPREMPAERAASTDAGPAPLGKDELFSRAMNCYYGHGGEVRSATRSMQLLEQAANAGSVEAMFSLGKSLLFGIGIAANQRQARHWLTRARENGHPGAKTLLAQCA